MVLTVGWLLVLLGALSIELADGHVPFSASS
jgi:hypothetical protein